MVLEGVERGWRVVEFGSGGNDSPRKIGAGIVYKRTNPKTGEVYIGRTNNESLFLLRQAAHDRQVDVKHDYEIIDRAEPGMPLHVAEESAIRRHGGPSTQGGLLANKRYEVNDADYRAAGGHIPKPTQ